MKEPVALITGASKGLGKAIAMQLINQGYKVYAGVRNIKHAPEGTIPVKIDLLDKDTLYSCAEKIISENKHIDLLINNAGVAFYGGADCMTIQEVQDLFQVNFFGCFLLTQLLLPVFRKQMFGKILFISSILVPAPCPYMGIYIASKSALEALAFDWHTTLSKWNISVSVALPGPLDTGIEIKHGSYFSDGENPYAPYEEFQLSPQPVTDAAATIIEKIKGPNPPFRFTTLESNEHFVKEEAQRF